MLHVADIFQYIRRPFCFIKNVCGYWSVAELSLPSLKTEFACQQTWSDWQIDQDVARSLLDISQSRTKESTGLMTRQSLKESGSSPTYSFKAPTPRFHPKTAELYHLPWFGPSSFGPCGHHCWHMRSTQPTKQPKVLGSKKDWHPNDWKIERDWLYIHTCIPTYIRTCIHT